MNYLGLICSIELSIGHSYEWANIRVTPNVISMEFSTDWSSKEFYIYIIRNINIQNHLIKRNQEEVI